MLLLPSNSLHLWEAAYCWWKVTAANYATVKEIKDVTVGGDAAAADTGRGS